MKLNELFALALLPLSCLAAKKSSLGTFESYHAKSQASAPLKLDDAAYEELTGTPRNHSVVILLTALEARFGCQLCRDFQPEWDLLAKSWAKGDGKGDTRTLLGTLDFADGKGTFQKVSYVAFCGYDRSWKMG
jgi:oligosaccharyltransferase complex subunit gamma